MLIDLSREQLFTKEITKAARDHSKKMKMETKRQLDREASLFRKHLVTLSPKINNSYLFNADIVAVAEGKNNVNDIVIFFTGNLFTEMSDLEKQIKKRLQKIKGFVKADENEKINFQILGSTCNLDVGKDIKKNKVVAVAQFVSSVPVRNFCCTL